MMEKLALVLLVGTMARCINGGNFFSRRSFEENPEETLKFAIRALDVGMDLDKQADVDKKEMALRGISHCDPGKCNTNLTLPSQVNECTAFAPEFNDAEDGSGCSCITGYECCPESCKDAVDSCKKGEKFGILRHDCCGCPTYFCEQCPVVNATCPPCDQAIGYEDKNGCPYYRCERIKVTPKPDPVCSKCQRLRHRTDSCGNHESFCECTMTPDMVEKQCTPQKPEEKDCYELNKTRHDTWGCKSDSKTCQECYHWSYQPLPAKIEEKVCKSCEMAKVKKTTCGYKTICQCRTYDNCFPDKPEELACHSIKQVDSTDTFQCSNTTGDGCTPCYTWKYVAQELSTNITECDKRCTYKRPVSSECGSGEVCQCNGKDIAYCQPKKPAETDCYTPVKIMTEGSFMCQSEKQKTCIQCWSWTFAKKQCLIQATLACSDCETERTVHTGCGCSVKKCDPIVLENCRPAEPPVDECYSDSEKVYTEKSHSEGGCLDCFYWNRTRREQPEMNECSLTNLPNECYETHHITGSCDQVIKKCTENKLPCEETYGSNRMECPIGHEMVTMKSKCGKARDACAVCSQLISSASLPAQTYDAKCYYDHELSILNSCKQNIHLKKACNYLDDLMLEPCKAGVEKKLFFDDCNCPKLKCIGCPSAKQVDVQLLLDSSGTMGRYWRDLINKIKGEFIGSIMTNPASRMAIARFGTDLHIIVPLSSETSGSTLDSHTDFINMQQTHTAAALKELLPSFQEAVAGNTTNDIKKILVVITDGDANGPGNVAEEAKKWVQVVDEIHVLGFGDLNEQGLEDINGGAPGIVSLESDFGALEKAAIEKVLPSICDEKAVQL